MFRPLPHHLPRPALFGLSRREFLRRSLAVSGVVTTGPLLWSCSDSDSDDSSGPGGTVLAPSLTQLGALQEPDANGIMLPAGFTSRVIAESGLPIVSDLVGGLLGPVLGYNWHTFPDGGATFAADDGGWVYVSNSESVPGGVGAIRFSATGERVDAYRLLSGTLLNCAGGPTPWGTWLSCEERPMGQVHECFPFGSASDARALPALGTFEHEAVAVDPLRRQLFLTEDIDDARFYRFVPSAADWPAEATRPALDEGLLQVMVVPGVADSRDIPLDSPPLAVQWVDALNPDQPQSQNRIPEATIFAGSEGIWYVDDIVYFTCKSGNRVWAYDAAQQTIELIYDDDAHGGADAPLLGVDNCVVYGPTRDLLVAEDGGHMRISAIAPDGTVAPILQIVGQDNSEITGPAFSPDGTRLYFSSQRGGRFSGGITYEVTGPFTAA
ncbi:MAG: alkaline phosphatase PhoX [Pseudomonadota bacterium]